MKKMLSLFIALLASSLLFAQVKFGIGVRGAVNVPTGTTFNDNWFSHYYDLALFDGFGFEFGAVAMVMPEELKGFNVSLEPGYAHNEMGWVYDNDDIVMKGKISYSSFDIPILVGYTIAKGNFRVTPQIGPYASIPIGSLRYDVESVTQRSKLLSNDTISTSFDISSKFLFGVMGGINVGYKVGNGIVNFNASLMSDLAHLKIKNANDKAVSFMSRRKSSIGVSYVHFF